MAFVLFDIPVCHHFTTVQHTHSLKTFPGSQKEKGGLGLRGVYFLKESVYGQSEPGRLRGY